MIRWALVGACIASLTGCIDDTLVVCGDVLCTKCTNDGTRCAVEAGCGNGILEAGELCDDGNLVALDGCSPDCRSDETCRNGVIDYLRGEQCDDGNALDHDGCSSSCQGERPVWEDRTPARPAPRTDITLVYDPHRKRVVMFGGELATNQLDDATWERDRTAWYRVAGAQTIPATTDYGATYDPDRRRVVMFGGKTTGGLTDATWEWDGTRWTERAVGEVRPSPRSGTAVAYDAGRHQLVVFGGGGVIGSVTGSNETWILDAAGWHQALPSTAPPKRRDARMFYDPARGQIVLFGGAISATDLGDTWAWNGTTWSDLTAASPTSPSPRHHHAIAYNAREHLALLYGGLHGVPGGNIEGDTWAWDGTWSQITIDGSAGAHAHHGLAFVDGEAVLFGGDDDETWALRGAWTRAPGESPARLYGSRTVFHEQLGTAILFGGATSFGGVGDEMWTWDGSWSATSLPSRPPPRKRHGMAYDRVNQIIVVFSGDGVANDTWVFETSMWRQRFPMVSPATRSEPCMLFDPVGGKTLLFGGTGFDPDTWTFDGTEWTNLHVPSPPSRYGAACAYDAHRRRIVLFGGQSVSGNLGDTWEWDGAAWAQIATTHGPANRLSPVMIYDADRARVLLFGGSAVTTVTADDTWEWDGTAWTRLAEEAHPAGRLVVDGFYDSRHHAATIFGGLRGANVLLSDTWQHHWVSGPEDTCETGIDYDGDGLTACADPDCWGTCAPSCPPNTTCGDGPVCGDHTCAPVESCRSCPEDCACAPICGDTFCDPGEACPGDCGQ